MVTARALQKSWRRCLEVLPAGMSGSVEATCAAGQLPSLSLKSGGSDAGLSSVSRVAPPAALERRASCCCCCKKMFKKKEKRKKFFASLLTVVKSAAVRSDAARRLHLCYY